jgi:hypothetical protein
MSVGPTANSASGVRGVQNTRSRGCNAECQSDWTRPVDELDDVLADVLGVEPWLPVFGSG